MMVEMDTTAIPRVRRVPSLSVDMVEDVEEMTV